MAKIVIDSEAIDNLRALSPGDHDEFLREITGIFLEDMPRRLSELEQALSAGDISKFTRAAHSIKGSSSNLGASALRVAAEKLEHHARAKGFADVKMLLAQVGVEFELAREHLKVLLQSNFTRSAGTAALGAGDSPPTSQGNLNNDIARS